MNQGAVKFPLEKWKSPGQLWRILILSLACSLVLLINAGYYLPFISDDAFISLRYADRFLEGLGLTWNDGELVEGYTNFLWVLASALMGLAGIDLVLGLRILGVIGTCAAILAVVRANANYSLLALAGGAVIGLAGPTVIWTIGGLEQPLLAGLLAWAVVCSFPLVESSEVDLKKAVLPGLLFGLICLTRADGILFVAGAVVGILLAKGINRKAVFLVIALAVWPLIFYFGHLAFRLAYYGQWVPNTALIKANFSIERAFSGAKYLARGGLPMAILIVAAAGGFVATLSSKSLRPRAFLLAVISFVWCVYVVFIGGDIFAGHRHMVPLVVLLAILAQYLILWAINRYPLRHRTIWVLTFLLIIVFGWMQFAASDNRRAKNEQWVWNGKVIGVFLNEAFGDKKPLVALTAAGAVPYYSKLPTIDMLGLNDRYIASHPPQSIGSGKLMHEFGDGNYVLSRKPDLVIFNEPTGGRKPHYLSGKQMVHHPDWDLLYTLVNFEGADPFLCRSQIWVRRKDGKLGMRITESGVEIPGYLFNSNPKSVARLNAAGKVAMTIDPGLPALFDNLELSSGTWRLSSDVRGESVNVKIEIENSGNSIQMYEGILLFSLPEGQTNKVKIEISSKGRRVYLSSVSLSKN